MPDKNEYFTLSRTDLHALNHDLTMMAFHWGAFLLHICLFSVRVWRKPKFFPGRSTGYQAISVPGKSAHNHMNTANNLWQFSFWITSTEVSFSLLTWIWWVLCNPNGIFQYVTQLKMMLSITFIFKPANSSCWLNQFSLEFCEMNRSCVLNWFNVCEHKVRSTPTSYR